ncbi:hypothetical protein JOF53_001601 [Crossiella equi]|uniref:Uncharacterized protein n=1 Tax=Crossiella equi TaxID=130796 RepID=A0ABS5A814_9PSEU|nr:hypothetical protein [Crossiella equi]MBP2472729.1 hypothetical protein [Crossiella equi]
MGACAVSATGLVTILVLGLGGGGGFDSAQAVVNAYVASVNEGRHNPELYCEAYRDQGEKDAAGRGQATASASEVTESGTSGSAVVTLDTRGPTGSMRIRNKLALTNDEGWTICGVIPEIDFPVPTRPGG